MVYPPKVTLFVFFAMFLFYFKSASTLNLQAGSMINGSTITSAISCPTESTCETKLLAVVKSRNQVYNSAIKIMDEAEVDRSNDKKMKDSIVKSLKTTFNELNKIIIRDIRSELNWQELDETDEEISEVFKSIDLLYIKSQI